MHKLFGSLLLIFLGFSCNTLLGQATFKPITDVALFNKKIADKSINTKSIKAEFTEEKRVSYLKDVHVAKGKFYFKKSNKMRWEKTAPEPYIFLVNGDQVKIKDNGVEKDISSFNEGVGRIRELMLMIVNGEFQNSKAFVASYFESEKEYKVDLIPKNKKLGAVFQLISLTFSKEHMQLVEMKLLEKSGDSDVMKFYNDVVNEELKDQLFSEF